ncbi:hypothetical protein S1R3Y_000022 [Vibrio phage vB_ValP_VA-RY-3]|nr:hypothetical protein S1R3Y_000022 [Vibrio phage vB_ValP_VA-RY-3]
MFKITVQASEKAQSKCELYTMESLEHFYAAFQECEKGDKLGSGFIRGELTKPERCDENLEYSKLLIVDADGGLNGNATPPIGDCHNALCSLGYSHILYTTHSHTEGYHKYRAIVELDDEIQSHELHANLSRLIDELKAHGCALHYAHEMDTWSQIWFLPRSDNPELYQHFGYFGGDKFEVEHIEEDDERAIKKDRGASESTSREAETLDDMFENIREGREFHHSLRNLSYQLAKDGVSRAIILATLRNAMETSAEAGTERWLERMKDLERLVDGGIQRASDEEAQSFEIPEIEDKEAEYTPPPLPPGRLGRAIQQCLKCMARPRDEFAFPMILGSLAAICGARFNAHTNQYSGLNLMFTVVADTGFGKGQISKFFNLLFAGGLDGRIINLSGGQGAVSFLGANNYTAPKPLHNDLLKGRSKIICMQEAGIMLGAKSGNADELSAYVMENFVNSANGDFVSTRAYSSDDNSLKSFRAPAISMVLESTEESLAAALKDMNALESGYIPRQTMFKINDKPLMNRNRTIDVQYDFDDDIIEQFKKLILEGSRVQATEVFDSLIVEFSNEQFEDYCDLVDHYSLDYNYDKVAKIIASRMAHKVIKFASLATIFNYWEEGNIDLADDCWEWAKKMGKWEMDNIDHNLSYMKNGNEYDVADSIIKDRLVAALHHNSTSAKQKEAKVVKLKSLMDRCTKTVDDLASKSRMSTNDFVMKRLQSMERQGLLKVLDHHPSVRGRNKSIQLLEGIVDDL